MLGVGETITPDSQKTYADQAKETATGTLDNIAGMVQPGVYARCLAVYFF